MPILFDSKAPQVDFVLHPTDLSEASERAFHHALAIAIRRSAQFTLLHAIGRRATDNWSGFPSVRSKLAEWRAAGTTDELEERIRRTSISKLEVPDPDPVTASLGYIDQNKIDMIVLATEGRTGLARLVRPSRAEELSRKSGAFTLFVPSGGRSFVDAGTGAVSLHRILVPVDPGTDPRPAMVRAVQAAALMDDPAIEITLLHVGDDEGASMELPRLPYCRWNVLQRRGDVVEEILGAAADISADAIYMSTGWHEGRRPRGRGGITEQVLHGAPCPVAVAPAG
ncbi:MAG TPA: universal stress protein [Longimicrobiales bacterium]|nr:universal stress protein [Longimicrobiales bacterium]